MKLTDHLYKNINERILSIGEKCKCAFGVFKDKVIGLKVIEGRSLTMSK